MTVHRPPPTPVGFPSPEGEEEGAPLRDSPKASAALDSQKLPLLASAGRRFVVCGVVAWSFSSSILLVNSVKYLYVAFNFRFPLFIAATHMALSWAACAVVLQSRKAAGSGGSGMEALMPWRERIKRVLPFSVCGAASVGCGNLALTFLYPSFHEILQASTPLFTLLTSVALRDRRFNNWAYVAMLPVCGGAVLGSRAEANFSWAGVAFSLAAMEFRALRAVLQGWLLCDSEVDSLTLCYYMFPFNLAIFGLWGAATEGAAPLLHLAHLSQQQPLLPLSLLVSAALACSFNVASFLAIRHLNALGAMVVNNAKTPATILLSLAIFRNRLSAQQVLGFFATFFGVWLYGRKGKGEKLHPPAAAVANGPGERQ